MSAQPNTQHDEHDRDEQVSDPQVVARLMEACETEVILPTAGLRARLARASRASDRLR